MKNCVLPDMLEHFEGTEMLCVSFERKNNPPVYTSDRAVLLNRDDEIVADFNQVRLIFLVTLPLVLCNNCLLACLIRSIDDNSICDYV